MLAGIGFYAYLLNNILWLQYVWGYDVLRAGLALVPGALVAAVVAARLGPLADKHGYRLFVVPGALVWAGAYLWYHQQVGLVPAFWAEWLPGQVLSGIGVGATLPLLGSAALASVPGGRYATASAVVSSARQLGGVLGIAVLVVILGDPTPTTAVATFHDGWVLSICAFVLVAVVSLPLGRLRTQVAAESVDDAPPASVLPPLSLVPAAPALASTDPRDLSDVPLLAGVPEDARHRLEAAARTSTVPAGTWLIREGDPPGSAYVVRRGRLEVEVGGRAVRELGPGEVLGELALLTGEARSASVRARRDSTVVEVPRTAFEDLLATDPVASRMVLTQVAERLRTAGGPPRRPRPARPTVVAVVDLHRGAGAAGVADVLARRLSVAHRVVMPGVVAAEGLERAEREHDRVVLVAGEGPSEADEAWRGFCLRQADAVVLVARHDADVPTAPLAPGPVRQPDVVLLGGPVAPDDRVAWVAATDAWQLVVTGEADPATSLRSLADRLGGRSLGLVLAGGGARAFAHVGMLRGLAEAGLHVDRVAGSSIGAVIAAIHATGRNAEELEELCYAEWVRRKPFSDWRLPTRSLAKGQRVHAAMQRAFGDEVIEGLPRQFHTVSTDLASRTRRVHRRGGLAEAATASARLPVLFAPMPQADGGLLVDGGVLDNLPVDLLTERDEGPVVAVNIGMGGSGPRRSGPPRVPALGETLLRTMMIGAGGAVVAARAEGAWVVTPPTLGVGLLEFHQMDRMVQAGRAAARRAAGAGRRCADGTRHAAAGRHAARRRARNGAGRLRSSRADQECGSTSSVMPSRATTTCTSAARVWAQAPMSSSASSVRAGEWWKRTKVPTRQACASVIASSTVAWP